MAVAVGRPTLQALEKAEGDEGFRLIAIEVLDGCSQAGAQRAEGVEKDRRPERSPACRFRRATAAAIS